MFAFRSVTGSRPTAVRRPRRLAWAVARSAKLPRRPAGVEAARRNRTTTERRIINPFIAALLLSLVVTAADWPIFGHDASHSGAAGDRAVVRHAVRFHVRWHVKLDAVADNAPIVVGDRLYDTSRDGTTYGIDTATGEILWRFKTRGPNITTSVPAFDSDDGALFTGGVDGYVHRLDPANGREERGAGFPAQVTLAPQSEKLASPITAANGYVYAQTGGYIGDIVPYVGHVVAIRTRDGSQRVFNILCGFRHYLFDPHACRAQRGGLWSRAGVVVDPDPSMHGRIYVASGNGPFEPSIGNFGDSVLALTPDAGTLVGYFTPSNYELLESRDLDVGTTAPVLLPRQTQGPYPLLAVQGGKDGVLSLLDRTNLPGRSAPLQTLRVGPAIYSAPAVWTDPRGTTFVFVGLAEGVRAFKLAFVAGQPRLKTGWITDVSIGLEGTSPVVSDGTIFVAADARLFALDPETGQRLGTSGALGLVHWQSPIVAGGVVYCSDESGYLTAFAIENDVLQPYSQQ